MGKDLKPPETLLAPEKETKLLDPSTSYGGTMISKPGSMEKRNLFRQCDFARAAATSVNFFKWSFFRSSNPAWLSAARWAEPSTMLCFGRLNSPNSYSKKLVIFCSTNSVAAL